MEYRKRRYQRLLVRADEEGDENGRWITTENKHKVHLNEKGIPDQGNPHVIKSIYADRLKKVFNDPKAFEGMVSAALSAISELPDGYIFKLGEEKIKRDRKNGTGYSSLNTGKKLYGFQIEDRAKEYREITLYGEDENDEEEAIVIKKEGESVGESPKSRESDSGKVRDIKKVSAKITHDKEAFSQERKDNAVWDKEEGAVADKILRPITSKVWSAMEKFQWELWKYTSNSDDPNQMLRVGAPDWWDSTTRKGVLDRIDALTQAIDMAEAPQDMWLQRGVGMEGVCKLFNVPEHLREGARNLSGEEFFSLITSYSEYGQDKAFMSCGSSKGSGTPDEVILNVYCPKGTKMLYVEPFSKWGRGGKRDWDGISAQKDFSREDETILQRGTKVVPRKVRKKVEDSISRFYIDVDVIGQEYGEVE